MAVLDGVNHRLGPDTIRYAASGLERPWHMKREHASPRYTTRWEELPIVRAAPSSEPQTPLTTQGGTGAAAPGDTPERTVPGRGLEVG
jgi:hypothetical protein